RWYWYRTARRCADTPAPADAQPARPWPRRCPAPRCRSGCRGHGRAGCASAGAGVSAHRRAVRYQYHR
ncbi:hypothetical protein XarbCFBP8150_21675, partial [Xanthomonas arboricola]